MFIKFLMLKKLIARNKQAMVSENIAEERKNFFGEIQSQIKKNEILTFPCILIEFKDNVDVKNRFLNK